MAHFLETGIEGLLVFKPQILEDNRGYFFESYSSRIFSQEGIDVKFIQDNQARSGYGVIRGLHYQKPPFAQTKLVRVISGTILDVVVDIRKTSPTYGESYSVELSAENKLQLLVPKGFAHGYSVISETAEVMYKCDAFYDKASEGGLLLSDPALKIDWGLPLEKAILSEKDKEYGTLEMLDSPFAFNVKY